VSNEVYVPGKSQVAHEILAYLVDHPEAQDTLDGIIEWWLLERKTIYQKKIVKEALAELVDKGLVLEIPGGDSRIHYKLTPDKQGEIRTFLEGQLDQQGSA
jgi:hypothetical protein